MVTVGSGTYTYDVAPADWAKLPKGYVFTRVPGMSIDRQDRVYVFNRNPNHVYLFGLDGSFLSMWDKSVFADFAIHSPHGFYIGHDQKVYLTDIRDHTVRKFTLDGKLLLTLGTPGKPGKEGEPFRRPTAAAISSSGDIFVADGYDNARVHKYSPEGKLLKSWGKPGTGPSEFNLVHGVWVDKEDHIWVADRQNHRIQIFDTDGRFLRQLTGFREPSTIFIDAEDIVYVPQCEGRMSIVTKDGKLLARWGGEKSDILNYLSQVPGDFVSHKYMLLRCLKAPGKFTSAHSCAVDSRGDLYVGSATGEGFAKFIRKK